LDGNAFNDVIERSVISRFDACQQYSLESLRSAGGYSGALFWRLTGPAGQFCLRRWPAEHPSPEQLRLIHAVILHANAAGVGFLPLPQCTADGVTVVAAEGHLWELTPWLPGEPCLEVPADDLKLSNAMRALASFHTAVADFPTDMPTTDVSPGIAARRRKLGELRSGGCKALHSAVATTEANSHHASQLRRAALRLLELFPLVAAAVDESLQAAEPLAVRLSPCLGDVHRDHVLFAGAEVSGLIDFGALRIDTPATDVARLLGSYAGDDPAVWQVGLAAYEQNRPLSDAERELVNAIDRSTVLMGGLNWIRWLYVERRQFAETESVLTRMQQFAVRLEHLARSL